MRSQPVIRASHGLPLTVCLVAGLLAACATKEEPDDEGTWVPPDEGVTPDYDWDTREQAVGEVLTHMGAGVVEPALAAFVDEARLLDERVQEWSTLRDDASRLAAQQQWRTTMLAWQYLEAMQLGPGGDEGYFIAGQGLRNEIYSWPSESPCFVDQLAGNEDWSDPRFFDDTITRGYGLDAVEYLLFVDTTDNECPDHLDINADGTWAALGEEGVARVRAQMAAVCTAGVAQVGSELHASWRDDYLPSIQSRSEAGAQSILLDDVRGAWSYIDVLVYRLKLCSPLELSDCNGEESGPVEHVISSLALAAIHQNLVGFRDMFTGTDGPGFDALLAWDGHGALASSFKAELGEAIAAAEALESVGSIDPEDERALALFQEVEDVVLMMRSEITDTLGMEPPYEHGPD